jgi:hypothetical protein
MYRVPDETGHDHLEHAHLAKATNLLDQLVDEEIPNAMMLVIFERFISLGAMQERVTYIAVIEQN